MKKILCKKTGVTVLEGLIALGLLALVAAGTFGVLLSVSRKASNPDIREAMILAVERAHEQLQMYTPTMASLSNDSLPTELENGLCGNDSSPLSISTKHYINCMLPPICDRNNNSEFYYQTGIQKVNMQIPFVNNYGTSGMVSNWGNSQYATIRSVRFFIKCNGFIL